MLGCLVLGLFPGCSKFEQLLAADEHREKPEKPNIVRANDELDKRCQEAERDQRGKAELLADYDLPCLNRRIGKETQQDNRKTDSTQHQTSTHKLDSAMISLQL